MSFFKKVKANQPPEIPALELTPSPEHSLHHKDSKFDDDKHEPVEEFTSVSISSTEEPSSSNTRLAVSSETPRSRFSSDGPEGYDNDDEKKHVKMDEKNEEQVEYLNAMKLSLIVVALSFSVFCMALDNTIISTAIPKITDDFKVSSTIPLKISIELLNCSSRPSTTSAGTDSPTS